MRWDGLFADLEAQLSALERSERSAEIGDRTRVETSRLEIVDRLRASVGGVLRVTATGGVAASGRVARVGRDWILFDEAPAGEMLVRLAPVTSVAGLSRLAAAATTRSVVESRLGLAHVLRAVARDRSAVRVYLSDGLVRSGTLDRVGLDFVDLAVHAEGEPRRHTDVRDVLVIPIAALVAVRRGATG